MKNLILGTAFMMIMALSANSYAAPNFKGNGERSKTEIRNHSEKKDDSKKGKGKSGNCHHHKKDCNKKK